MEFSRPEYWSGVAFPFCRGSSQPRDWTQVSCIAGRFFTSWTTGYQSSLHRINTHPCQWYCAWAIVRVPDADLEEAVTGSDHVRGNPGGHVLTWPFPTELKEGLRGQRHEISSFYNYGNRKRVKTVSYPRTYSSFHTVIWNQPNFLCLIENQM